MDRYRVVKDYQGGDFAMDRDFTIEQWVKQALEWCYADENDSLAEFVLFNSKNMKGTQILDLISEIWPIEFKKVRKDKKHFTKDDLTWYEHTWQATMTWSKHQAEKDIVLWKLQNCRPVKVEIKVVGE